MHDSLESANEELKRADHLFYVSLKYTRTVDVIKSIIERLINATTFGIEALLRLAKTRGALDEIPTIARLRIESCKTSFSEDQQISEALDFYLYLRKLDKAEFNRSQEFRRHVTMHATVEGEEVAVKIDDIKEYFEKTKSFVAYVKELATGIEA